MREIKIQGYDSVLELIRNANHAEVILGRQPTHVIMSKIIAGLLIHEITNPSLDFEEPENWKKAIGATVMGLKILVVTNKDFDYIEILEIEREE